MRRAASGLTSRSGASTPEAEAFVQNLHERGVEVQDRRADVGSADDVARLVAEIRAGDQPLRGVFHLAMVIDDAPLASLTRERMSSRHGPKAYGAWLLHQETRDMELDCFVMFSSVSSIFGNPAQGNYAAANAFLDSLAHYRHALGLPALTVNWGVLGGKATWPAMSGSPNSLPGKERCQFRQEKSWRCWSRSRPRGLPR